MHIGLIGGIGPAATIAYYSRLVTEFKQANVPLRLTIAHAEIALLAANAGANKKREQAKIFANHLDQLAGAGCDIAMITAMTGHFCFDETEQLSPIPLINATKLVDDYCDDNNIRSVGLLGSPPVLASHLFGLLKSPNSIVPNKDIEKLGAAYMELAHSGFCSDDNREFLINAGATMVSEQGAEAVLLAGTDLGLAFDGQQTSYPVIDALEVHVAALLKLASTNSSDKA
ncbi:MAG: aspartate/glutamate racemase family protein [Pseudomonadota bacterium]